MRDQSQEAAFHRSDTQLEVQRSYQRIKAAFMELINPDLTPSTMRATSPREIHQEQCQDAQMFLKLDEMLKEVDQLLEKQAKDAIEQKKRQQKSLVTNSVAPRVKPASIATLYEDK